MNNLPLSLLPNQPWFYAAPRASVGGNQQLAPDFAISQTISVLSRFSANPGVLTSGRRPERPGLKQ